MPNADSRPLLVGKIEQSILNLEYRATLLLKMLDATRAHGQLVSETVAALDAVRKTIETLYQLRLTLLREPSNAPNKKP